ncbi:DUF1835 domain-containing protein [Paenibacillus sp. BAC0078]
MRNGLQEKRNRWDPVPHCTHVHLVYGDSFAGSLKQALLGLGWEETHKLIVFRENYSIGPLLELDSPEGRQARSTWFRDNIAGAVEAYSEFEEDYNELQGRIECIPQQAEVVLWISNNACEQTAMRHMLHLLHGTSNVLAVYDACAVAQELYNRPDAYIEYRHSGEIPADKLCDALLHMDGSGRLDNALVQQLQREWQAITGQAGVLRIWRDGAVAQVPADYFDNYLLDKLDKLKPPAGDNGFLKSARLIGEAIAYCEQYIGDAYFEYRLRQMIYDGILEIKGVPAAMRFYSVRRRRDLAK